MRSLLAVIALLALSAGTARAQLPQVIQQRPLLTPQQQARLDSLRRDSAALANAGRDTTKRQIVKWVEPDSVEDALQAREGFTITQYQGTTALFDAMKRQLTLKGTPSDSVGLGRAAVKRDQTILVGDTIVYDDSAQRIIARGDTVVIRDPTHNEDDVIPIGLVNYDVATHEALTTDVNTVFPSGGNRWYISAGRGAYMGDTAKKATAQSTFYGFDGTITTCDDSFPHYHFQVQELKFITRHILVARPAILYIADIPVMWLPFVFQDLRSGRRSGILTPRFGIGELLRSSPTYRRDVENVGYYFAINDYTDATAWLDWRSSARPTLGDPGWTRYNGEFRYHWLDRFVTGSFATLYQSLSDGETNTAVSWQHQQDFSQASHLNMNINYETSTTVQQLTYYNPYSVLAVISSQVNLQQQLGPASISLGGSQKQYPGRTEIDRDFPDLSVSTKPISAGTWLTWSPSLSVSNTQNLNVDAFGNFSQLYSIAPDGTIDSVGLHRNQRNTAASFETPITILGFSIRNSFQYSDQFNNYPEQDLVYVKTGDTAVAVTRTFANTFRTGLDWTTGVDLPRLLQGSWNVVPSVSVENADPGAPFLVRTQFTGSDFLQQSKRLVYGLALSPTFYGLFGGLGGVSRFRHTITPALTFSFSPTANVDSAFLVANGQSPVGYLGGLRQEQVSLSLTQVLEAKLKPAPGVDPDAPGAAKLKILSLNFDPLAYDLERAQFTHRPLSGFTTGTWGYSVRSDLLPGFDFRESFSLFQGDPLSDTAVFKPYWQQMSATFSVNHNTNPFTGIGEVLGLVRPRPPSDTAKGRDQFLDEQLAAQRVAGTGAALAQYAPIANAGQGWQASFTFNASRTRPPVGNLANVIQYNPTQLCSVYLPVNPAAYALCIAQQKTAPTNPNILNATTYAAPYVIVPSQTTLQASTSFNITPKWAAQWQTTYDFRAHNFASHVVTLQRDLHDWRAIFSFTQAPTGSFAFTFLISLKAEPALKFNYDKQTYETPAGSATAPSY